jgi:membrane protease YdiL (CAAX protease family)
MSALTFPSFEKEEATTGKRVLRFILLLVSALLLGILGSILGGLIVGLLFVALFSSNPEVMSAIDPSTLALTFSSGGLASLPEELLSFFAVASYLGTIGVWIVAPIFLRLTKRNRPILSTLTTAVSGNTPVRFLVGLGLGFGLNAICILVAVLAGNLSLEFVGSSAGLILLLFLVVFIQSSSEELLVRCYLYQRMGRITGSSVITIVVTSLLFAAMHLGNTGITAIAFINIALSGILAALLVVCLDSPWAAFAEHTAWNFTQNILFGLPNSGAPALRSVFGVATGTQPTAGFAYDPIFGVEGSGIACIVLAVACVAILLWWRSKGCPAPTNIWPKQVEQPKQPEQPATTTPATSAPIANLHVS